MRFVMCYKNKDIWRPTKDDNNNNLTNWSVEKEQELINDLKDLN
ncbi:hypothetical protein [Spiroplasma citri]|nr:hypothetical protein [Spiroplasma citri]